ncbi:MAG: hypothetical protein IPO28_03265 [Holophagaceae bacterium]|nr:hypothetical protein [Holophagaceae bacterium]
MKLPILFNPASGTSPKDPDALLRPLPKALQDRVEPIPFGPPWDFGPSIDQALRAGGPLFVWGGDGTIHHAAKALIQRGCPVPLAAIPGGSGNGLVRGLRTPLEPSGALRRLLEGQELRMDLPRLDGEPFLNLCGTGFEAAVAHRFDAMPGRGFTTYARACWQLWRVAGNPARLGGPGRAHSCGLRAPGAHPSRLPGSPTRPAGSRLEPLPGQPAPVRLRAVDRPGSRSHRRGPAVGHPGAALLARPADRGLRAVPGRWTHPAPPRGALSQRHPAPGAPPALAPGRRARGRARPRPAHGGAAGLPHAGHRGVSWSEAISDLTQKPGPAAPGAAVLTRCKGNPRCSMRIHRRPAQARPPELGADTGAGTPEAGHHLDPAEVGRGGIPVPADRQGVGILRIGPPGGVIHDDVDGGGLVLRVLVGDHHGLVGDGRLQHARAGGAPLVHEHEAEPGRLGVLDLDLDGATGGHGDAVGPPAGRRLHVVGEEVDAVTDGAHRDETLLDSHWISAMRSRSRQ